MGLSVTALLSTRWRCYPTGVDYCSALRCICACAGVVKMVPPSYLVCSPRSTITHASFVFSFRSLPAFSLSVTRPQAVPLSQVLSQMQLFSPAPYFRRTAALTHSTTLREGLTKQWLNEQWPNVSCTQERPLDPAVVGALRLRPGASPPPKNRKTM